MQVNETKTFFTLCMLNKQKNITLIVQATHKTNTPKKLQCVNAYEVNNEITCVIVFKLLEWKIRGETFVLLSLNIKLNLLSQPDK